MEVNDVGRWRFCPACGRPRAPVELASEDQDDDRFEYEDVRCSGCDRAWIACCCEPLRPCEWQPIETAPKDGTSILGRENIAGEDPFVAVVCFATNGGWSGWHDGDQVMKPDEWTPVPP